MSLWDQKPCIVPIATVEISHLLLPLETYTLYNRVLLPREIEVDKSK